jgi:hypothetical protein
VTPRKCSGEPAPGDPNEDWLGLLLHQATKSATVLTLAGTIGPIASIMAVVWMVVTGAKSCSV